MLVGRNDSGKSAILEALDIFFGGSALDGDDKCVSSDEATIELTCEFDCLPESLVLDSSAPTSLQAEFLVNSDGRLVIKRSFNGTLKSPKETSVVAIAEHPSAGDYSDLLLLKNAELKRRAQELGVDLADVDQTQNPALRAAIWTSADDLQVIETELELAADNAKKIWTSLQASLPSFALFKSDRSSTDQDSEAQDPMKAAIQEALSQKQAELDELTAYVESEVRAVAEATLDKLRQMDPEAATGLTPQFQTPSWKSVFKVSLTDDQLVPVNKRGSGIRRLILLNFFRAKAEQAAINQHRPGVIYAVEEPETSQHPDNQRLLLEAFEEIASVPGNQVVLTSHTPVLARRLPQEAIRYVERHADGSRRIHGPSERTNELVTAALGVLPDHDVRVFVGVEGRNDIEFFRRVSAMLAAAGEPIPDLAAAEAAGALVFIPLGGSSLDLWVAKLKGLNRPEVHIFDRDTFPEDAPKYATEAAAINALPNAKALVTSKLELENYIHARAIELARPDILPLPPIGDFVDVPQTLAEHVHGLSDTPTPWEDLSKETRKKKESQVKTWLNRDAASQMTPDMLTEVDDGGDIRNWLAEIGQHLQ